MNYYLTTDTHFNHTKMIEYCNRPENFEGIILENILKVVKDDDVLIHLGDICIGKDEENHIFIQSLKCKKILVKGNHDNKSNQWYLEHGWDFVCDKFYMKFEGKIICFSHTPQKDNGDFDINIHGHFHNQLPRLLKRKWVVDGEEERNKYDLSVLTKKHLLLSLEDVKYLCMDLHNCINQPQAIKL